MPRHARFPVHAKPHSCHPLAIGLLIGMEDVSPEKQSEYLSALLTPLCQQVEMLLLDDKVQSLEESSAKVANIQQVIMSINALSKCVGKTLPDVDFEMVDAVCASANMQFVVVHDTAHEISRADKPSFHA